MLPELVQCVYAQSGKCIVRRLSLEGDSKAQAASTGEQIDLDAFIESIQSIYGLHENECASNPASRIHGSVVVANRVVVSAGKLARQSSQTSRRQRDEHSRGGASDCATDMVVCKM